MKCPKFFRMDAVRIRPYRYSEDQISVLIQELSHIKLAEVGMITADDITPSSLRQNDMWHGLTASQALRNSYAYTFFVKGKKIPTQLNNAMVNPSRYGHLGTCNLTARAILIYSIFFYKNSLHTCRSLSKLIQARKESLCGPFPSVRADTRVDK